jgi:hypothetical protein
VSHAFCFALHALQVMASPTEEERKMCSMPLTPSHGIIRFDSAKQMSNTGSSAHKKPLGSGVRFEEP